MPIRISPFTKKGQIRSGRSRSGQVPRGEAKFLLQASPGWRIRDTLTLMRTPATNMDMILVTAGKHGPLLVKITLITTRWRPIEGGLEKLIRHGPGHDLLLRPEGERWSVASWVSWRHTVTSPHIQEPPVHRVVHLRGPAAGGLALIGRPVRGQPL